MPEFHAEPYLYLAGLTHKAALISWGGFYFRVRDRGEGIDWKLVDDSDLDHIHPPRRETIGARSEPFGKATVEVFKASGERAAFVETMTANHAWVTGLEPNTEYTYRVMVNDEEWAAGERRDWIVTDQGQGLVKSGRAYDNRFRTQPHPDEPAAVTFAVLGDFGTGIRHASKADRRQREIAAALERAVDQRDVRLLLTTGDNIYAARTLLGLPIGASGDEDDDWFFTFYQPYRYIINRIPVYPTVGNHDSNETEASDDRQQLLDNFFLDERFTGEQTAGRASIGPGLFYRFHYGTDIEFVCIDTSRQSWLFGKRYFEHPNHAAFLEAAFPDKASGGSGPGWLIPFTHHPPYCAGPRHSNSSSMIERLTPLFKRAGVSVVFSGHEHNFQYSRSEGIDYFITGAGGKIRINPPTNFAEARTRAWASAANFIVVEVTQQEMCVTPFGELDEAGNLKPLIILDPAGELVQTPIIITS